MKTQRKEKSIYPFSGLPKAQGLYRPENEHDACGLGFVANIEGQKSHDIVLKGIQILINLTHRGACGCDPETGDGAMRQINEYLNAFQHDIVGFLPVDIGDEPQATGVVLILRAVHALSFG